MPFLTQTCCQTRKLGVFTWDTISQLNNRQTSFVTYQDDNNQQGCAYFLLPAHTRQIAISPVSITRSTHGRKRGWLVSRRYIWPQITALLRHPLTLTFYLPLILMATMVPVLQQNACKTFHINFQWVKCCEPYTHLRCTGEGCAKSLDQFSSSGISSERLEKELRKCSNKQSIERKRETVKP